MAIDFVLLEELFHGHHGQVCGGLPCGGNVACPDARLPVDQLHVPLGKEGLEEVVVFDGFGEVEGDRAYPREFLH